MIETADITNLSLQGVDSNELLIVKLKRKLTDAFKYFAKNCKVSFFKGCRFQFMGNINGTHKN